MRAAVRAVSRRRAFLVVVGTGWAAYGMFGILANPRAGTTQMLDDVTRHVPLPVLGWLWVVSGIIAVASGSAVHCPRIQSAGYAALAALAGLWAAAFTIAVPRYPTASGSASVWVALTIGILIVAGMDDPLPAPLRKKVGRWT